MCPNHSAPFTLHQTQKNFKVLYLAGQQRIAHMSDLIVKDNALMNASYNLDLVEQRLILLAIIEARASGRGINANDPLVVRAETYMDQFEVHRNTAYQALKDACRDLFHRQFSYTEVNAKGNLRHVTSRWVSQIAYNDREATVDLIFAPVVVPLITRLEEQFSSYDIEQVSRMSSAYAVRLYEILICWRTRQKTPVIPTEELRKRLGVLDSEYQRMERFKSGVLHMAIAQINAHTDITVSYEQQKTGRTISGFSFSFAFKDAGAARAAQLAGQASNHDVTPTPQHEPEGSAAPKARNTTTVKATRFAGFAGIEKTLFENLRKKCPTLTPERVARLAKEEGSDEFTTMRKLTDAFAHVDFFEI